MTIDDWIKEWTVRVGGRKDNISFLEEKCQTEKKFHQEESFNSFHHLKRQEEKQLDFDEQLLGFLKELKAYRELFTSPKDAEDMLNQFMV